MNTLSLTIIIFTHNELDNIINCIKSAKLLSKNIIVIDMESQDCTVEQAKKEQVVVYNFPFTTYVEPARSFGIEKITTDWALILDADERLTPALVNEIKDNLANCPKITHYLLPRKNIFGSKWLKYGGWWPDYQTRLIYKPSFITWPTTIHSSPLIKGKRGHLKNPIIHLSHGKLTDMVAKTIRFEKIESELLFQANKPVSVITFFRKFVAELFRRLIRYQGFRDGTIGIIESIYQAFSRTITYLYLYEKKKNRSLRSIP